MSNGSRKRNAVDEAVERVGGPTKASHICGCSFHAIYKWRRKGFIPLTRIAVLLSDASGITVRELAGMPPHGGPAGETLEAEPHPESAVGTAGVTPDGDAAPVAVWGRRFYAAPAPHRPKGRGSRYSRYKIHSVPLAWAA